MHTHLPDARTGSRIFAASGQRLRGCGGTYLTSFSRIRASRFGEAGSTSTTDSLSSEKVHVKMLLTEEVPLHPSSSSFPLNSREIRRGGGTGNIEKESLPSEDHCFRGAIVGTCSYFIAVFSPLQHRVIDFCA